MVGYSVSEGIYRSVVRMYNPLLLLLTNGGCSYVQPMVGPPILVVPFWSVIRGGSTSLVVCRPVVRMYNLLLLLLTN